MNEEIHFTDRDRIAIENFATGISVMSKTLFSNSIHTPVSMLRGRIAINYYSNAGRD